MKINEITDRDKTFLRLQDIEYNFSDRLFLVNQVVSLIGKSAHRRGIALNVIESAISSIDLFLKQGFDITDPDIISAIDIKNQILNIESKL